MTNRTQFPWPGYVTEKNLGQVSPTRGHQMAHKAGFPRQKIQKTQNDVIHPSSQILFSGFLKLSLLALPVVGLWRKFWLISQCCCCWRGLQVLLLYWLQQLVGAIVAASSLLFRRLGRGGSGGIMVVLGGSGGASVGQTAPRIFYAVLIIIYK